jgi:hypothetical protein
MIRLNPSHSHTLIIVVSRSVIPIYLDEFSCQHNAMSVIDLPLDVIFEIANWLPTSSYTALALTCGPLYKSLDHRRWTPSPLPYHRRGTDDSFKLLPLLAVGPFVFCKSCQSLHRRDDRPLLEDTKERLDCRIFLAG